MASEPNASTKDARGRLSPLASVSATRSILEAHGLSTKYSLGQNFLVNDDILRKIITLAEVGGDDFVLEVGPGIGTLTIALLKHAACVASVERDTDLPAVLGETLAPWADRFALVSKDALDLTTDDLVQAAGGFAFDRDSHRVSGSESVDGAAASTSHASFGDLPLGDLPSGKLLSGKLLPNKLVANLPYAVAATLVLDYFQRFPFMESATVMVQKEVADRMGASPGSKSYGAYTVKLGLYAQPAGRFSVGPGNFFPSPRVDSAVLRLNRRLPLDETGAEVDGRTVEAACMMADAAFASRRKTLANSCKTFFAGRSFADGVVIEEALSALFDAARIDPRRRGETLSQSEFIALGRAYLRIAANG